MDLDDRYPALSDLSEAARRRVPRFVWEYLDSATGDEGSARRTTEALDRVALAPRVLRKVTPDLTTTLMGEDWSAPFGMAPVGMSGLIWPGAEVASARVAAARGLPYCLSNMAAETPEVVGPETGGRGWFQLYAPSDPEIRRDLLKRAWDAGFRTLILTGDINASSRRERQRRARLTNPMRMTPKIVAEAAMRPAWSLAILRSGTPSLKTLEPYAAKAAGATGGTTGHVGYALRTAPDWDYLDAVRQEWQGKLVLKGILHPDDAGRSVGAVDGIWVSAHGGRQFAAAPAPAEVLPGIRAAVGDDLPIIVDGGVRSGTDVVRLLALGADMAMLGRAFHHGMAALGPEGVDHAAHILTEGIRADMGQLGAARPAEVRGTIAPGATAL